MLWLLLLAWLVPAAADPHAGRYTSALGVACTHCHQAESWTDASRPAFAVARRMARMTATLNEGPLKGRTGVTCATCHRGRRQPPMLPEAEWRPIFDDWPATALVPTRDADRPAREIYRNLQVLGNLPARDIRAAMSAIVVSLGVNCEYCHAGDEWDSDNKPAKKTAREMMRIELPREIEGAEPSVVHCYVCHQGAVEP